MLLFIYVQRKTEKNIKSLKTVKEGKIPKILKFNQQKVRKRKVTFKMKSTIEINIGVLDN